MCKVPIRHYTSLSRLYKRVYNVYRLTLVSKAKVESLVSIRLTRLLIRLILNLFRRRHCIPDLCLFAIEMDEVLPVDDKDD